MVKCIFKMINQSCIVITKCRNKELFLQGNPITFLLLWLLLLPSL